MPDPDRAGAGTLVELDALLLTHHHSDHLVGLSDVAGDDLTTAVW